MYICNWTLEIRDILKILWKRGEIAHCSLGAISPLFYNIFCLLLDVHVSAGTRFSLRDKRLFEISEFEITRVDCTCTKMKLSTVEPQKLEQRCLVYHG